MDDLKNAYFVLSIINKIKPENHQYDPAMAPIEQSEGFLISQRSSPVCPFHKQ